MTAPVMVVSMVLVILAARRDERAALARDLQVVTVIIGYFAMFLAAPAVSYPAPNAEILAVTHVCATLLLNYAVSQNLRWLGIAACVLGIMTGFGLLLTPLYGPLQTVTATWFLIAFCALVVPHGRKGVAYENTGVPSTA